MQRVHPPKRHLRSLVPTHESIINVKHPTSCTRKSPCGTESTAALYTLGLDSWCVKGQPTAS